MQEKAEGGVDASKEKGEVSRGGDANRHPKSAANEVPANNEDGRGVGQSTSTTSQKTATVGQVCFRSSGIIIFWIL